jgi:hypothetical protein
MRLPRKPAWEVTGLLTLDLRAQRFGIGTGRIYTLIVTRTNSSQLSSSATVTVSVPMISENRASNLITDMATLLG